VGTLMLMPRLAVVALSLLPLPRAPAPRLAIAQLRVAPGQVSVSLAAIVASVSLTVSMVIMVASFRDSLVEIYNRKLFCRWLWAEHVSHYLRFVGFALLPLIKLLHVGQIQRAEGAGPFPFVAHVALEIPINPKGIRNDRIGIENRCSFKVYSKPLKHDNVWSNEQKSFRKIVSRLSHGVEELPGDG
jgi:hypothetical protein